MRRNPKQLLKEESGRSRLNVSVLIGLLLVLLALILDCVINQ